VVNLLVDFKLLPTQDHFPIQAWYMKEYLEIANLLLMVRGLQAFLVD
jgi:hypothetical protein